MRLAGLADAMLCTCLGLAAQHWRPGLVLLATLIIFLIANMVPGDPVLT